MILLISATFPPEPVVGASLVRDLAEALIKDERVRVISPRPSRPLGFMFSKRPGSKQKFEHIVLDSFTYPKSRILGRMLESYSFGKHSSKYIKMNREAIHCCYVSSWPLIGQYLIIRTLKKYSIPSVVHIQDVYPESLSNKIHVFGVLLRIILLPLDKYILKNSTRIIANSRQMCNTFIQSRGIYRDKIEIVHNWQNENEYLNLEESKILRWKKKVKNGSFIFMYMGNIGAVAGVQHLIQAFAKVDAPDAVLIIAGNGAAKMDCMKLAASLKLSNIQFLCINQGEVPYIQRLADVMLLPVRKGAAMSSVPSKLPSYMFSAKPIIACLDDASETANAIREAECGWIVPPEDKDALSGMMSQILSKSPAELIRYGENGYEYAIKNYSSGTNLQKLKSIIIQAATI